MSAVEEFKQRFGPQSGFTAAAAYRAIAELEAEQAAAIEARELWHEKYAELEADAAQLRLHWQREAKFASRTDATLEKAEAELAALKGMLSLAVSDMNFGSNRQRKYLVDLKARAEEGSES